MKLIKIIRAILAGMVWGGVYKLTSKNMFKLALVLFKAYELLTLSVDEEGLLIKGYLLAVIGEDDKSLHCFERAVSYINVADDIKECDKIYLRNYIYIVLRRIGIFLVEYNRDIDFEDISKQYLYLFPYNYDFEEGEV